MKLISASIKKQLSKALIQLLWELYEEGYSNTQLDDYQFFKITTINGLTTIFMWQECPPASKQKQIPFYKELEVWIINDGKNQTMLLPIDY